MIRRTSSRLKRSFVRDSEAADFFGRWVILAVGLLTTFSAPHRDSKTQDADHTPSQCATATAHGWRRRIPPWFNRRIAPYDNFSDKHPSGCGLKGGRHREIGRIG